jgi:FkbM family methyltransferase
MGVNERYWFEHLLRPGMITADIGANLGLYSLTIARCVGVDGLVYVFEPDPDLFTALRRNCEINGFPWIKCFNVALGEKTGRLSLRRSAFNSGDNRMQATSGVTDDGMAFDVDITTFDQLLGDDADRVDFIKIDVQGWELSVFKGMEKRLSNPRPLLILFEFGPDTLLGAGVNPADLLSFLTDRGFELSLIDGRAEKPVKNTEEFAASVPKLSYLNLIARRN